MSIMRAALPPASRRKGGEASAAVAMDAADPASVEQAMVQAETQFGSLDVMVASAGIGIQKSMLETTFEDWNAIIAVNLTGVFLCGKAAAARMAPRGFGRIINISSVAGLRGIPGRCAYGASKGGVNSLTQVMAVEFGAFGITVNAIAPGPINTPLTEQDAHGRDPAGIYGRNAAAPLRRAVRSGRVWRHSWLPTTPRSSLAIRSPSMAAWPPRVRHSMSERGSPAIQAGRDRKVQLERGSRDV